MLKASMKFEIATAVSIGFVGVTGPSAETDSKRKQIITKQNGVPTRQTLKQKKKD